MVAELLEQLGALPGAPATLQTAAICRLPRAARALHIFSELQRPRLRADLVGLTERQVGQLSGGELQRFAIGVRRRPCAPPRWPPMKCASACNSARLNAHSCPRPITQVVAAQKADIYMFDEPSSYLDVKQRLKARTAAAR